MNKGKFAADTKVTPGKTMGDIEKELRRYGATQFAYTSSEAAFSIGFIMKGRAIRFSVPLPDANAFFMTTGNQFYKAGDYNQKAHERAIAQRWRALLLVIRAKLESVELGVETLEDAFLAQIVLPSGETFGSWSRPQLTAVSIGNMPQLLPGHEKTEL